MSIDEIRDHTGEVRRLGYVAPTGDKLNLRSARTALSSIRDIIPQTQWAEVDYFTGFPATLINNQGQEGACVGASGCGGSQRQRYIRTGQVIPLSWQYLYDQINGGSDNGANIIDSMQVLEKVGVPPIEAYPKSLFKANAPLAAGTEMYLEDVAVTLTDANDCATALLLGMFPQVPIYVNNSFEHFTGDGVAWNDRAPKGNASNHSVYLAGLKKINATWYFLMVNSWGTSWGPWGNGACLLPLAGIDNPGMQDDGYCHCSTLGGSGAKSSTPEASA